MRADILIEHGEEIEILWSRRASALRSPRETLATLAELERRIDAHLDGLALDRDGAHACFERGLSGSDADAAFAAAAALLHQRTLSSRERVLAALPLAHPQAARGMRDALVYLTLDASVRERVSDWLASGEQRPVAVAIHVLGAHGLLDADALVPLLADARAEVRLAAASIAARAGVGVDALRPLADEADVRVRDAALAALAHAGAPEALARVRRELAGGPATGEALELLGALGDASDVALLARAAAARGRNAEAAIRALGALGVVAAVPELLELMRGAAVAPAAGEAFRRITGIEPPADAARADAEADDDARFEELRPWPDADATAARWREAANAFASEARWRLGEPLDARAWRTDPHAGDLQTRREEITRLRAAEPGALKHLDLDAPASRQRSSVR